MPTRRAPRAPDAARDAARAVPVAEHPHSWTLTIPGWQPARLNQWDGRHWGVKARLKRQDREIVWAHAQSAGVPPVAGRRRVSLAVTLTPRQRGTDPDAFWKSVLDALVACGLLLDDDAASVELGPVTFTRGTAAAITITLEDVT